MTTNQEKNRQEVQSSNQSGIPLSDLLSTRMGRQYERTKPYSQECAAKWGEYFGEPIFDELTQFGTGPAIVVPQGRYEVEIPLKHVLLIKKCLDLDPDVLNKFLNAAIGSEEELHQKPQRAASRQFTRRSSKANVTPLKAKATYEKSVELEDDIPFK